MGIEPIFFESQSKALPLSYKNLNIKKVSLIGLEPIY